MSIGTPSPQSLVGHIDGVISAPGDARYNRAGVPWNVAYRHRPRLIVEAMSERDVARAVTHAAATGTKVAVQSTGHGVTVPADDAVLIVMAGLDSVHVVPETSTAVIGGGVTWAPVLAAAQDVGLAPLVGSSPGVGAVGYTLGGGFGWLGRKYGLSCDLVRSFRVVLADGSVVTASAESHPDLFWALRGGGAGCLGVVTQMEIDLVPVTTVYGGNLFYPVEDAAEVFDHYVEWSAGLPDDFTTAFTLMNYPPMEMVPQPLRGRAFAIVRGCHCGDRSKAAELVDQVRRWREPRHDLFGPLPFAEMAAISHDPEDPLPAVSDGRWLTGLSGDVVDAMVDAVMGGAGPSPVLMAETRHAGGAIARTVADASYASRSADRLLQIVGVTPDAAAAADAEGRIARLWDRLDGVIAPGGYVNFTEGRNRLEQARRAFDAVTWERLIAVKRTVDPANVFSHGLDLGSGTSQP